MIGISLTYDITMANKVYMLQSTPQSDLSPQAVERLIKNGYLPLWGAHSQQMTEIYERLRTLLSPVDLQTLPSAIGGNEIRGRFPSISTARRDGIYYGPEVDPYLGDKARDVTACYAAIRVILDEWFQAIVIQYNLPTTMRDGSTFDTLTMAWYTGGNGEALVKHTDFGLLTIGLADGPGLQFWVGDSKDGQWLDLPPNTPYIHTASWLQGHLKATGLTVGDASHRVVNCSKGRFFAGFFYEPSCSSMLDGKTYGKFIEESFDDTYQKEHAKVVL